MKPRTFKEMVTESIRKKNVKLLTYGKEDIDINELQVWLSSDDIIGISHDKENDDDSIKTWGANYFSWMDDDIEITIDVNGKQTIIKSSYDSTNDKDSWTTTSGIQGKMKKITKYGRPRNVYVIPMETNTKDIIISIKALIIKG